VSEALVNDLVKMTEMCLEKDKEIERLNKELQDTKEHLGEYLHEQEEENKKLKKLIIALWHNNSARILNKEQIDLLNNIVFGNDEVDLGSDKE
jgi:beta-lactamase class D